MEAGWNGSLSTIIAVGLPVYEMGRKVTLETK